LTQTGVIAAAFFFAAGCVGIHQPGTRPLSDIPAEQAKPEYWYAKPAAKTVVSLDFDRLFRACENTARDYQFTIDRQDYRRGLLTTRPMISKQIFEPWRRDAGTVHDVVQSTLQTVRRTIRIEIIRTEEGAYEAQPKVLVEELSQITTRITSPSQYRNVFFVSATEGQYRTDEGKSIPFRYWYAIGRDSVMERHMADEVGRKAGAPSTARSSNDETRTEYDAKFE
jgi:hypothetical protein